MAIRTISDFLKAFRVIPAYEPESRKDEGTLTESTPGCRIRSGMTDFSNLNTPWVKTILLACSLVLSGQLQAQDHQTDPLDDIIAPDLDRREIRVADIDSENWEFGVYGGVMSIEDFGSNTVSGFQVSYHISENFFAEANYGTTEAGETSFETLSGSTQILTDDQRSLTYYDLSLGYNLFQGEIFIGSKRAYNANFYLTAGAGNTDFADDSYFTYSIGIGSRFFIRDWFAIHGQFKAHSFSHELLGEEKNIINLEPNVGLTFFF